MQGLRIDGGRGAARDGGMPYRRQVFEWDDRDAWDRLRGINPLAQVPTLALDDGTIVTESAAIVLWIAGRHPHLLPDGESERALDRLSALDVYVAMISRWRPGRAWLSAHCPKAMASVLVTERHPVVASAWTRNFD